MVTVLILVGVTGCSSATSDAAFCGPTYSRAIDNLADAALADPGINDVTGGAVADVVAGHDAGCR